MLIHVHFEENKHGGATKGSRDLKNFNTNALPDIFVQVELVCRKHRRSAGGSFVRVEGREEEHSAEKRTQAGDADPFD